MNNKTIALIAVALLLGGTWYFMGGKNFFHTEMQEAVLVCARPECMNDFTVQVPVSAKWPVLCPKCGQKSAYPALPCPVCEGTYPWIPDHPLENCPRCDAELPR